MKSVKLIRILLVWFLIKNVIASDSDDNASKPSALCTTKKCVMKCCPKDKIVKKSKKILYCAKPKEAKEEWNLADFNKDKLFGNTDLSHYDNKIGIFESNETQKDLFINVVTTPSSFDIHLIEMNNVLYVKLDKTQHPNNEFCLDYREVYIKKTKKNEYQRGIWIYQEKATSRFDTSLRTYAMFVSCAFLLLVLVVYFLLPELRNLCGMILMAYVSSLCSSLFFLAVIRLKQYNKNVCIAFNLTIYFSFLSTFCWMHVMSYDIWWTFRGYAKARPIHRRGETFKFLMYCLYAWGLPLAMTINFGALNNIDTTTYQPWFVHPKIPKKGCFMDDNVKYYYLYIPMLILILCNWVFYIMTAFNVWRLSRGTSVLDSAAAGTPQAHRMQRERFLVYLKLSVVMGLNWFLEILSYWLPNKNLWFIGDLYNILIGFFIFLIFVCKRKILRKLHKVITRSPEYPSKNSRSNSATSNTSSQELQTLQPVCPNPKGP